MAIFEITTRNDLFIYNFQVPLEEETYLIEMHYNRRLDLWVGRIPNALNGIPLLGRKDLFENFHYLDTIPPGELKVIDLDKLNRDAEEELLSDRVVLGYRESI